MRVLIATVLVGGLVLAVPTEAQGLKLILTTAEEAAETPVAGWVSFRNAEQGDAQPEKHEAEVPGTIVVPCDAEAPLLAVSVEAPGYWAPEEVIDCDAKAEDATIALHPTGILEGRLQAAPDADLPEELKVRFRSAPGAQPALADHWKICEVTAERFRCEVPAGTLDIGLRASGHITIFLWNLEVAPHGQHPLGTVQLQQGASVIGWIGAPDEAFRFRDVEVVLEPQRMGFGPQGDRERRGVLRQQAEVNSRGFFELQGVAAGTYRLTVRHEDYAPTVIAPVEVYPGRETEIRQVHLAPPAKLTIQIWPEQDPFHQPWRVEVSRESVVPGYLDEIAQVEASSDGMVNLEQLDPGHFRVAIVDSRGSSWHYGALELTPGDSFREIALPFERLEGRVTLGDEPLAGAWLYFGGRHGAERVKISTNEEGKFYVYLPEEHEGTWLVDIEKLDENLSTRVEGIRVARLPGQPWAKVEIELPDTRLQGRTVDSSGQPVANALVRISAKGEAGFAVRTTRPEGGFTARGRKPRRWILEAKYSDGKSNYSSEVVTVDVAESQEPAPVELVLRRDLEVTGLVVAPDGTGVVGALVLPLLEQPDANLANTDRRTYTDTSGAFRLRLPEGTEGVQLTVFPPGFAATQPRFVAREGEPVPVEPVGGTVRVVLDAESEELPHRALDRTYLMGDYWLGFSGFLRQWAQANGSRGSSGDEMVVPQLEPGTYTACFDTHEVIYLGRISPGTEAPCVQGVLEPFGELVLRLPVTEEASHEAPRSARH